MRDLPRGTVTFLFTDIEGSTLLLRELGEAYVAAFAEHRRVLRRAFSRNSGVEVGTGGDAFFVVFRSAAQAVAAAAEAQDALRPGPIWVRMGLHTRRALHRRGRLRRPRRAQGRAHRGQRARGPGCPFRRDTGFAGRRRAACATRRASAQGLRRSSAAISARCGPLSAAEDLSDPTVSRPAAAFAGRKREVSEVLARLDHGSSLSSPLESSGIGCCMCPLARMQAWLLPASMDTPQRGHSGRPPATISLS